MDYGGHTPQPMWGCRGRSREHTVVVRWRTGTSGARPVPTGGTRSARSSRCPLLATRRVQRCTHLPPTDATHIPLLRTAHTSALPSTAHTLTKLAPKKLVENSARITSNGDMIERYDYHYTYMYVHRYVCKVGGCRKRIKAANQQDTKNMFSFMRKNPSAST